MCSGPPGSAPAAACARCSGTKYLGQFEPLRTGAWAALRGIQSDHNAAMHKVSQLPYELIVVRSCVLMEEILSRWKRFPLP
jgi:hypothetical protein